ncbi:MAG: hypothetical protein R3350_07550, partial [Saprospiraceae bacterium]|nr:hypothetical protein [Saprospiraceae bacterium]
MKNVLPILAVLLCFNLNGQEPPPEYWIQFPPDVMSTDCTMPEVPDVIVENFGCSVPLVSVSEMKFETGGGACYKIFRTFRVINWCEYDGEG